MEAVVKSMHEKGIDGYDVSRKSLQEQREYRQLQQSALKSVVRRGEQQIKNGQFLTAKQALERLMHL